MTENLREQVEKKKPLIHCITNPISINSCANAILSVGAKPIMAEHPKEVREITATADALMLNTGNITDARMESMMLSIAAAKEKGIPTLLDAVGVACSRLRREYVQELLKVAAPSVIKGNYSEILALRDKQYFAVGVDADPLACESNIIKIAKELAKKHQAIILATGELDIITDGKRVIRVKNGTPRLANITGTGCMLGSLCTAFMTASKPMDAVISACCYFGICGELAVTDKGNGSFMVNLMDRISTLNREEIIKYSDLEEIIS